MPCVVQLSFIGAGCRKRANRVRYVSYIKIFLRRKVEYLAIKISRFGVLISQLSLVILNLVLPTNRRIRIFAVEYLSDIVSSD